MALASLAVRNWTQFRRNGTGGLRLAVVISGYMPVVLHTPRPSLGWNDKVIKMYLIRYHLAKTKATSHVEDTRDKI